MSPLAKTVLARVLERLPLCRVIWTGNDPYLLRVYLFRFWRRRLPGVFLHYFFRGDGDRELHNHPWMSACSVILTNGYYETRVEGLDHHRFCEEGRERQRLFMPGDLNLLTRDTFHRVELLDPSRGCWTLFVVGRRIGEWGFLHRDGRFEEERDYHARKRQEARP